MDEKKHVSEGRVPGTVPGTGPEESMEKKDGRLAELERERDEYLDSLQRLKAEFAHYLVYPARSERHRGLQAFREWLLREVQDYGNSAECVLARASGQRPRPDRSTPAKAARRAR